MSEARMLRLPAQATFETVPAALEQASAALRAGEGTVEVDLSVCERFDSSLLALLLELSRRAAGAEAGAARLRVGNPPPKLRKLAALYGVDELLFERN